MTTAAVNASSLRKHLLILFLLALQTSEPDAGSVGASNFCRDWLALD
jgi:hypothetical protein